MKKFIATIKNVLINSTNVFNESNNESAEYETMAPLVEHFMNRTMWLYSMK